MWTIDKVNTFYDADENIMTLVLVFGGVVNSINVLLSREHSEYKWCDIDETIKLLPWEQQKKGVHIFYQMLKENKDRLCLTLWLYLDKSSYEINDYKYEYCVINSNKS